MNTYLQHGRVLDAIAPAGGVVAGVAYKIGSLFGVARETVAQGVPFAYERTGVWGGMPKAAGAWTFGAILYWDDTAKAFTTTATNNMRVGYAAADAASGDTVGSVVLGVATI
jgi:predicted RecA/RadA family phage recombinase